MTNDLPKGVTKQASIIVNLFEGGIATVEIHAFTPNSTYITYEDEIMEPRDLRDYITNSIFEIIQWEEPSMSQMEVLQEQVKGDWN